MGDMKPRLSYYGVKGAEMGFVFRALENINKGDICDLDVLTNTVKRAAPVEPERVKERVEWITVYGACPSCGYYEASHAIRDHSYATRLSLITYPELYICSKAGECSGPCIVGRPHERVGQRCHEGPCYMFPGVRHCIPYVPEDEADWFIYLGPPHHRYAKEKATQYVKDNPGYRAFRWSTGLKGAPCE